MNEGRTDFFVTHAGADRAWAEWVAWQLLDAGYTVELDVWDWAAGQNFVTAMSSALTRADRVVALFSAAYFEPERYTAEEWSSSLVHVPGLLPGRLIPVWVEKVPTERVPPLMRPLVACAVFGVEEQVARQSLLTAVAGRKRPDAPPEFPGRPGELSLRGGGGPPRPGAWPPVWGSVPARNPGFTGRDRLLVAVRDRLLSGERAVCQAMCGMGGVGKTQLAAEYAHRFARVYHLVWWVNAEQARLIGEQFAELAGVLGCMEPGAKVEAVRRAVLDVLRQRDRWLLIFDNAENPEDITGWLPGGPGHVLITSRSQGWDELAVPVAVDVLARGESVAILQSRVAGLGVADADLVAAALGDLPLAIAQAASYMTGTGMTAGEYTRLLAGYPAQILDQGRPPSYPRSLAAVTRLAFDRLRAEDQVSADLAAICAFLAPEPIPAGWFIAAAAYLPGLLTDNAAFPVAWGEVLAHLRLSGLARVDGSALVMHRLTQAIIRSHLTPHQATTFQVLAQQTLSANHPGDPDAPGNWPGWARLLPHLLTLAPATHAVGLRTLAADAARYQVKRGDAVLHEMLDAQEVGNVGRVLATLSSRPEAAHMPTEGVKWETSREAAHAVAAVPSDGLRLVADHFSIHLQGDVAWAEGLGRVSNRSGAERPVRLSCVLIREQGQWAIVQSHASLPVGDAEIFKLESGC